MTTSVSSTTSSSSQIVEQLIYLDSQPIRTNQAKIKTYESNKTLINSINTSVSNLQKASQKLYEEISKPSQKTVQSKEGIASAKILDSSYNGKLNLDVKQLAVNTTIGSDKVTGPIGISGSFKLSIGDSEATIEVSETDTIQSIRNKINNTTDFNANASIIDGRLILTAEEGGDASFNFEDTDGILNKIGLVNDSGSAKNVLQKGQNAIFTVNGVEVEHNSNTVKDVIDGVELELQDIGTVTIKTEEDVDALYTALEDFIKEYNTTFSLIDTELTKEGGFLRGDSSLSMLKSNMRSALTSAQNGTFKFLSEIGIEFKSNLGKNAKLEIADKDALKNALRTNKKDVLKLFVDDTNDNGKLDSKDGGILGVLNNYLDKATDSKTGFFKLKKDTIESSIKTMESRNERLEANIAKKRTIYEKQFLQMDLLIEQMNTQMSGLQSMMTMYSS